MREVAPGIFAINGLKTGRSYLIEDRDGLALVDTSSPTALDGILRGIAEIGRRVDDLRTIIATHYHYDHTGNISALVERSGAQVCAHAADIPYIGGKTPWMQPKSPIGRVLAAMAPTPFSVKVDRVLTDGDEIDAAGGLHVVHAPGHTPGSIALHSATKRVLFAGDAFMNVLGLQLPPSMSSHDMAAAKRSIARLAELEFDAALPGHGQPVLGRAGEKLREWSRRWLSERLK